MKAVEIAKQWLSRIPDRTSPFSDLLKSVWDANTPLGCSSYSGHYLFRASTADPEENSDFIDPGRVVERRLYYYLKRSCKILHRSWKSARLYEQVSLLRTGATIVVTWLKDGRQGLVHTTYIRYESPTQLVAATVY